MQTDALPATNAPKDWHMTPNPTIDAVLSLLHDETFCSIVASARKRSPFWNEFRTLPMPEGYEPEQIWAVLSALRKQEGHIFGFPSYIFPEGATDIWCSISGSIRRNAIEIATIARTERAAHIMTGASVYQLTDKLAEDIAAALKRDGLILSMDDARSLITTKRTPRTLEEKAASNIAAVLADIRPLAKRPFSPWMIDDLMERIGDGCESFKQSAKGPISVCTPFYVRLTNEDSIRELCRILNNSIGLDDTKRLVNIVLFSAVLWDILPLEQWNGSIELIVRTIFFEKTGMTLLKFIPLSSLSLHWELGTQPTKNLSHAWTDCNPNCGEGNDMSMHVESYITMIRDSLESVLSDAKQRQREDDPLFAEIQKRNDLNHRQKGLLSEAVSKRNTAVFSIESHRAIYQIAYATARSDLYGLVDMGYLEQHKQGRKLEFTPSPHLITMLGKNRLSHQVEQETLRLP